MQTVERTLRLKNGPPWGFRLQETYPDGLIISQIRKQSPAEMANLQQNDKILAIENVSTQGMSSLQAVHLINNARFELGLIVQRLEKRKKQVFTLFLESGASKACTVHQELTTQELQLSWEKEPSPELSPYIQVPDPNITPITMTRLLTEYELPEQFIAAKKPTFTDSKFLNGYQVSYPTPREQMELAHKVAESIMSDINKESRGACMFEVQRKRADKHVKEGPEPMYDPIANSETSAINETDKKRFLNSFDYLQKTNKYNPLSSSKFHLSNNRDNQTESNNLCETKATAEELERMPPLQPPPTSIPGGQTFPNMSPSSPRIPPAPPPPPGQPRSLPEFMDKIKLFPKNQHNQVNPQICFDLAIALHNSDSRGANMFAKRRAKSRNWVVGKDEEDLTEGEFQTGPVLAAYKPKLTSKLAQRTTNVSSNSIQFSQSMKEGPTANNLGSWKAKEDNSSELLLDKAPSKPTWRPVKFNIPQKAK